MLKERPVFFTYMVSSAPLEQVASEVNPDEFSKIIAYYPDEKNAYRTLAKAFPNSDILVFEFPEGQTWSPT